MRVLELEIRQVRGIPDLHIKPSGKSLVVFGPNGSGKSAIVDALDFLLTGRISRLTGEGTEGITLRKHGPHIDHKPGDAVVRAVLEIPGADRPIEVSRCMAQPDELRCDDAERVHLDLGLALAKRGLHMLTRRDLLKYITAKANTRAQEIQDLLNLAEVEALRKAFVAVERSAKQAWENAKSAVSRDEARVRTIAQCETYDEALILKAVNDARATLGGDPIAKFAPDVLKAGLQPPAESSAKGPNIASLSTDTAGLRKAISSDVAAQLAKTDTALRDLVKELRADPDALRAVERLQLMEIGIRLIDESGKCPLCDHQWAPGKLVEYLQAQLKALQTTVKRTKQLNQLAESVVRPVEDAAARLERIIAVAEAIGLAADAAQLGAWRAELQALSSCLGAPLEKYPDARFGPKQVQGLLAPANAGDVLSRIESAAKEKVPAMSSLQTAWDTLTRVDENLRALQGSKTDLAVAQTHYARATVLRDSFVKSRDTVLSALYNEVAGRFAELYQNLHGTSEEHFTAVIRPDQAGLEFEVDFLGRGNHPPHALHSQGHQDSMGLCLYLSLAERLTGSALGLVILDDVVMSVDTDHRKSLCGVLRESFSGRQFIITTHDRVWANQLVHEGVVRSKDTLEFYDWDLETGPRVNDIVDMWDRIAEDIAKNDVPAAAARLRRGLETFFDEICCNIQAPAVRRRDGRLDLGDLLPSAMSHYGKLLKQAKSAAQAWGDKESLGLLNAADACRAEAYRASGAERWAIDLNVHFNAWANFSKNDFLPVVQAFRDLCTLFQCPSCGGTIGLTLEGHSPASLKCPCGHVSWNLKASEKGQ